MQIYKFLEFCKYYVYLQEIFLTVDGYLRYDLAVFNAGKGVGGEMTFTSHTTFKEIGHDTRWIHEKVSVDE